MREPGYYWVRYKGEWIVAEYIPTDKVWESIEFGEDGYEYEDILQEIDERRIERHFDLGAKAKRDFEDLTDIALGLKSKE